MKSVLVFRIGSLGDTLVALPAMWLVRGHFSDGHITLLCDHQVGRRYVLAADLLQGSGIVDDFVLYPVDRSSFGRFLRPIRMLALLVKLLSRGFDTLVYLAPSHRTAEQVKRDCRFFRLAGIREFVGTEAFASFPQRVPGEALPTVPPESELLVARLGASGVATPVGQPMRTDLGLGAEESRTVTEWQSTLVSDGRRRWIAVGPGSKMPAKIWPAERYQEVVRRLIERWDIWPVIFGGREDRDVGARLLASWGRGYNAAGALGLRAAGSAIGRCALYLGNDTGTMHMAAAAGIRCVAIFSSRSEPGLWNPFGSGHHVFRTPIDCEGCMLEVCVARRMECVLRTGVDEVFEACSQVLSSSAAETSRAENV